MSRCLHPFLSHTFAKAFCIIAFASLACGCARRASSPDAALKSISGDRMLADIRTLSSDEFEGRGPGSKGEELTIQYLQDQFRSAGLEPGNPDGSYLQNVRLVGITADPQMKLSFTGHGRSLAPKFQNDFVAWTKRMVDTSAVDADMIFAGYGVQAPEFQWDDFKGVNVRGKVLVVLINDPPVPDPQNPDQLDPKTFGGKAMTYYGRWTYKFEKAAELGAAGCLIVHQTDRAGYPWEVVRNSWSAEQFDLESPDKNMNRLALEGWISRETADKLFRMAGLDLGKLSAAAATRDFRPVPLGLRAKITIHNRLRTIDQRHRAPDRQRSEAKRQLRNLYRALGSLRHRPGSERRSHLPWRRGQCLRHRGAAGNRAGLPAAQNAAAAEHSIPLRHRRGAGFAGLALLRGAPLVSARAYGHGHQHGYHERARAHSRYRHGRHGKLDAR